MFSSSVYFGKQKCQWRCDSVRLKVMRMKAKSRIELQISPEIHANISISKQRSLKLKSCKIWGFHHSVLSGIGFWLWQCAVFSVCMYKLKEFAISIFRVWTVQIENIIDYTGRLQGRSSVGGQSMNAVYAARSEAREMEGNKTLLLRSTPFLSYGRNVVTLKRTCLLLNIFMHLSTWYWQWSSHYHLLWSLLAAFLSHLFHTHFDPEDGSSVLHQNVNVHW